MPRATSDLDEEEGDEVGQSVDQERNAEQRGEEKSEEGEGDDEPEEDFHDVSLHEGEGLDQLWFRFSKFSDGCGIRRAASETFRVEGGGPH